MFVCLSILICHGFLYGLTLQIKILGRVWRCGCVNYQKMETEYANWRICVQSIGNVEKNWVCCFCLCLQFTKMCKNTPMWLAALLQIHLQYYVDLHCTFMTMIHIFVIGLFLFLLQLQQPAPSHLTCCQSWSIVFSSH